jgi:hypothetical protein
MASIRRILRGVSITVAGRASGCKHNRKHTVRKGEHRLLIKNPGPAGGERGYCAECGLAILEAAQEDLESLIDELKADQSSA